VGWTTTAGDLNRAAAALIAASRHLVEQ